MEAKPKLATPLEEDAMGTAAVIGTFDTKGAEYSYLADRLRTLGCSVMTIDCGVLGDPPFSPDIDRRQVAAAAGHDVDALAAAKDRGAAVKAMAEGATAILDDLMKSSRIDGAIALGGTGGSSLAAAAFRALPLGVPKIIVSTAASGDTSPYIGETDLIMVPSIVDVSGLNRISTTIIGNAAAALAGMIGSPPVDHAADSKPLIAASMFGVTTPCITRARTKLESLGYEVLVFHMTGAGGRTMESLIRNGMIAGVLDITTTELADNLVGGIFDAGPDRLSAAAGMGVPATVSVGALDMVNFGPPETIPSRFDGRLTYEHNATTTLMRTTADECRELGRRLAAQVRQSRGPTQVLLPLRGVSAIDTEGGPFHDHAADDALFSAIREGLTGSDIEIVELDTDINDPAFADAAVEWLHQAVSSKTAVPS
jgi:uncharacterized protein (UPF0261 family)